VTSQKHRQLPINELTKIDLSLEATLEQMIASTTIRRGIITFSNEDLLSRVWSITMPYILL